MDKGTLSNLISTVVLTLGLSLPDGEIQRLILSAGLFALSGGITNSLAVKMLFDRIPGLIGSGVIPARFKEIRREIKKLIMEHFFNEAYLREFLARNARQFDWTRYVDFSSGRGGPVELFVEQHWERLTSLESLGPVIRSQMDKLMDSSFGGFLHILGKDKVEELVGDFVSSSAHNMKERILEVCANLELDSDSLQFSLNEDNVITDLERNVDVLLEQKLEQLDAPQVKRMLEDVIRKHLGWLIVWGNVFGGLIGIAAHFVSGR